MWKNHIQDTPTLHISQSPELLYLRKIFQLHRYNHLILAQLKQLPFFISVCLFVFKIPVTSSVA